MIVQKHKAVVQHIQLREKHWDVKYSMYNKIVGYSWMMLFVDFESIVLANCNGFPEE